AYTSEIEKLEKRWAENPKGRNFAPLADAYRKAGELDRAIELCTAGLERHPDYVSAHIVFGRCLIDQKNDPGASAVFRKVLALEHASEEPTSPRLDVKGTPADIETFDGTLDFNAVAHSAAKADGIEVQEEVVLKPQDLVVEGLAHTQFESGIFAMPPEAAED